MKNTFLFLIAILFVSFESIGQNNLITVNPDFVSNTDGWSVQGDVSLTHIQEGAETPGAAKVNVISTNGSWNSAKFKSGSFDIPQENRNKLNFFSFYGKTQSNPKTVRILIRVTNTSGETNIIKSKAYNLNSEYFKENTFPVYFKNDDVSFVVELQIGIETGIYIFDDFKLIFEPVDLSQVNQFGEWQPKNFLIPENAEFVELGIGNVDNTVTIEYSNVIAPVLRTQFGVNSNFRSKNSILDRTNLYTEFGAFRFPAGSGSNQYFWDGNIPNTFLIDVNAYSGTSTNFLDIDHFLEFKNNLNGEPAIVINYFYARYGYTAEGTREARVKQAAEYAASWVHYYNIEHNAEIKYWEIGNECYGPWETGYDVNGSIVTGKEYGEDFCVFAEKMKAVDSTIKIGAVLGSKYDDWNAEVLKEVKNSADFLIMHNYYNNIESSEGSEYAMILTKNIMKSYQFFVLKYTGKPAGYFPVAFTEYNSQGPHTTTIANGLFIADILGEIVKDRFFLSSVWVNEWGINNNETHGIISKEDPDQPDYTARQSYTPYYYYGKCFGDQMIKSSLTGSNQLKVYASKFSSGEIGLVILNFASNNQPLKIDYGQSDTTADTIFYYSVYADNQNIGNKKFYVNGYTGNTPGGGPVNLDSVPAFMSVMTKNNYINLPNYSITYIVIRKSESGVGIKTQEEKQTMIIYPNPVSNIAHLKSAGKIPETFKIFDVSGKDVIGKTSFYRLSDKDLNIDVSGLTPGVYFFQTGNKSVEFVKK